MSRERSREEAGGGERGCSSTNTHEREVSTTWECAHQLFGKRERMSREEKGGGREGMAGSEAVENGCTRGGRGGRRHVAHTPSRRRLRLRGAYQPPSIISMQISIFHPVFPKFMQTSSAAPFLLFRSSLTLSPFPAR